MDQVVTNISKSSQDLSEWSDNELFRMSNEGNEGKNIVWVIMKINEVLQPFYYELYE